MRRLRSLSRFGGFMALAAVVLVLELGSIFELHRRWRRDQRELNALHRNTSRDLAVSFAPGTANEAAIRAEQERLDQRVEALRADSRTRALAIRVSDPGDTVTGYFQLGQWIETMRGDARSRGIGLRSAEAFGFRSHLREAPTDAWRQIVAGQQAAVAPLLRLIFECAPASVDLVQREHPKTVNARRSARKGGLVSSESSVAPAPVEDPSDFFEAGQGEGPNSIKLPDCERFKVAFTGTTATLRSVVCRLAAEDSPYVLRDLRVQSKNEPVARHTTKEATPDAGWLPIGGGLSNFTLIVETYRVAVDTLTPPRAP